MKKVLILHPNFPAQFKSLAIHLGKSNYDVRFLCQTHYDKKIPGINRVKIKGDGSHERMKEKCRTSFDEVIFRIEAYRNIFLEFKSENWNPDIIISHTAWGCGFYAKEIWPNSHFIAYVEWWFDTQSDFFTYDQDNKFLGISESIKSKVWRRNAYLALEIAAAETVISPTQWQKQQLPKKFRDNCLVIHEGINFNKFKPNINNISKEPLLTYGTRGFEAIRGFDKFIKSLPLILSKWPTLKVEIAGDDQIYYSGNNPRKDTTWGAWAKEYLSQNNLDKRVKFRERMIESSYIKWLQGSWCHIYLTHPFVTSWSLLEALGCGMPIVASDVEAVREFKTEGDSIKLVDHRDPHSISDGVSSQLRSLRSRGNGIILDENIVSNCGLSSCLDRWIEVLDVAN